MLLDWGTSRLWHSHAVIKNKTTVRVSLEDAVNLPRLFVLAKAWFLQRRHGMQGKQCALTGAGYWCKRWVDNTRVRGVTPWDSNQLRGGDWPTCLPTPPPCTSSLPTIHWGVCLAWSLLTPSNSISSPATFYYCFVQSFTLISQSHFLHPLLFLYFIINVKGALCSYARDIFIRRERSSLAELNKQTHFVSTTE